MIDTVSRITSLLVCFAFLFAPLALGALLAFLAFERVYKEKRLDARLRATARRRKLP